MRFFRKHRHALLLLGIFHLIFFFPSLFMGRVVSPIDILRGFDPWASVAPAEPQNPTLNDIATSYLGLMQMLKSGGEAFHWNRAVASGIPGFGSAGAAVLTPLVALPALLLPISLVCSGILLLKINLAFLFAYLWLRQERLRKRGAATGAMLIATAGTTAVWWLWPATNAIALYPAMLWIAARLARGKRVSFTLCAVVALSLALSGYPPAVLYGAYLAGAYFIVEVLRHRRLRLPHVAYAIGGIAAAALIASPMLASFFRLLRRTGYLTSRQDAAATLFYPLDQLAAFLFPYRLGDPVGHMWTGDGRLGRANNFVEATIYIGAVAILVALIGVVSRKAHGRYFWIAAAAVIVLAMFGVPMAATAIAKLPGLEYAPLTRLRFLLPLPAGYLVASALSMRMPRAGARFIPVVIGALIAAELALFAGRFYPFVKLSEARVPQTPTLSYLQKQRPPFRILPFFYYLLPNSSELAGLEDIRSHFSSEERYRRMLQQVDPQVFGQFGTILIFNGLRTDLSHPFLRMLGVRYFVEQPTIDILRWAVDKGSIDVPFGSGSFAVPGEGFHAVGLDLTLRNARPGATLRCTLSDPATSQHIDYIELVGDELRTSRVYLRLPATVRGGESFLVRLEPRGLEVETPAAIRLTRAPHVLRRELPDGRIFENVTALPRYWAVWGARQMGFDAFLAAADFTPEREAIFESTVPARVARLGGVPPERRSARIRLLEYGRSSDLIRTTSSVPFLLASSEKASPELRVTIDGKAVEHSVINGLFAAAYVDAGDHQIRFERRIGRGFWPLSAAGWLLLIIGVFADVRQRPRGRATSTN